MSRYRDCKPTDMSRHFEIVNLPTCPDTVTVNLPTCPDTVTVNLPTCPDTVTVNLPTCPDTVTVNLPTCPDTVTVNLQKTDLLLQLFLFLQKTTAEGKRIRKRKWLKFYLQRVSSVRPRLHVKQLFLDKKAAL